MSTVGDIATVAAPTIVALAAIGTSTWQQSRSRAFDRAEREKERQHDREMRKAAERHERKLSDLDYQRRLVDDVTAALESASHALLALAIHPDGPADTGADLINQASATHERLKVVEARMFLRFGPEHHAIRPVSSAIEATRRGWAAAAIFRYAVHDGDRDKDRFVASMAEARDLLAEAIGAFLIVTGGIVGSAPERD